MRPFLRGPRWGGAADGITRIHGLSSAGGRTARAAQLVEEGALIRDWVERRKARPDSVKLREADAARMAALAA